MLRRVQLIQGGAGDLTRKISVFRLTANRPCHVSSLTANQLGLVILWIGSPAGVPARVAIGYGTSTTGRSATGQSSLLKGTVGASGGGSRSSAGGGGGGGVGGGSAAHATQKKELNFSNENVPEYKKRPHGPLEVQSIYPPSVETKFRKNS